MPKQVVLGNGNIQICFDKFGQVTDFYFPYVGQENQTGGKFVHKIGVFADGRLSWLDSGEWNVTVDLEEDTFATKINAVNNNLGVVLDFNDVIYNESNIFIRKVNVTNLKSYSREIKVYFNQQFLLYESFRGDTAYYDPESNVIVHYEGRRMFLINGLAEGKGFSEYSVGLLGIEGKEGTYKDAEDGILSKNGVEHGIVDSVIGFSLQLENGKSAELYYWITVDKLVKNLYALNSYVLERSPQYLSKTSKDYWGAWVNKQNFTFYSLHKNVVDLFKKSLFYIRANVDNEGGIIASGDSDLLKNGRDTYSYVWHRDGAFTVLSLDKAGYTNISRRFFEYSADTIDSRGFFMHKYRCDKALGSSWHPWVNEGKMQYPIQEDETALVIYALCEHYKIDKDIEFIEKIYNPLIKKAAEFMVRFIDPKTNLPNPSYDLWEEKFGVSTFTCCAVYRGLIAASKFAGMLGKISSQEIYLTTAEKIKKAIFKHLYSEEEGVFYKRLTYLPSGDFTVDKTLDMSSVYGVFRFGVLDVKSPIVKKEIELIENRLGCNTSFGGIPRYEGDRYFSVDSNLPGNPWIITSLWLAQYYIMSAESKEGLDKARKWIDWVVSRALKSGILSEQLNPHTGEQLSAAPLTWSHAEYVYTVLSMLEKLKDLGMTEMSYEDD